MTLHQLEKDLVDDKKVFDKKQFKKFIINVGLFLGLGTFTISYLMSHIVNIFITLATFVLGIVVFITVLQYATENDTNAIKVNKLMRLWFLWIILLIGGILALKLFRFM